MINSDWLEGAFVVRNEGFEYDSNKEESSTRKTVVTAQKYCDFAEQHIDQSTYFNPFSTCLITGQAG